MTIITLDKTQYFEITGSIEKPVSKKGHNMKYVNRKNAALLGGGVFNVAVAVLAAPVIGTVAAASAIARTAFTATTNVINNLEK